MILRFYASLSRCARSAYGGEIETPKLLRLADRGVTLDHHHAGADARPGRSADRGAGWYPRPDSNRHALRRRILNPLRLPFRHSGQQRRNGRDRARRQGVVAGRVGSGGAGERSVVRSHFGNAPAIAPTRFQIARIGALIGAGI